MQKCLGPFLEHHNYSRPSEDQAEALVEILVRSDFNRSEAAINDYARANIHPRLLDICDQTYKNISTASNRLTAYQERFNFLPNVVLDSSVREQMTPEADFVLLKNRLHSIESEAQSLALSLEQREQDCASLQRQVMDLRSSHSWKITSPLRALGNFFRAGVR